MKILLIVIEVLGACQLFSVIYADVVPKGLLAWVVTIAYCMLWLPLTLLRVLALLWRD